MDKLNEYLKACEGKSPGQIAAWALETFGSARITLASSFNIEDQVLTEMVLKAHKKARIFTLDTGRLFQETYETMHRTMQTYNFKYEVYAPESSEVEELTSNYGPDLMYESVVYRKMCCDIRKMKPLKRALNSVDAWICGLRKEQSEERSGGDIVQWDENFGIYKINPLFNWTLDQVKEYAAENNVPYNKLFDQGFVSIGCAPCTRAVKPGEDFRAGRWWWESDEKRECGLHLKKK